MKQKVTREADIPDGLEACDKVPQLRQLWLQTGALTSLPSAAGGRPAEGRGRRWAAGRHRRHVFLRMQPLPGSEGEDLQRKGVGGIPPFETAKVGCAERRGE